MMIGGLFAWLWRFAFGDDEACRLCLGLKDFPDGTAPHYVVGCENLYCRPHCRRYCECGAAAHAETPL